MASAGQLAGGGVALLMAAVGLYCYPAAESFKASSLTATLAATKDRPVEIQAGLGQNLFDGDEAAVPLSVSVLNRGAETVTDLLICAEAPGFEVKQKENCVTEKQVEGQKRVTKQIPIKALPHSGMSVVSARVFWRQRAAGASAAAQGVAEQAAIAVGPVKIEPVLGAARWSRFGGRIASIFKDLTLPLILLWVGAWLNRKQADREKERQDKDRDREEERQRIDQDRETERLRIEKEREEKRLEIEKQREEERLFQEKKLADRQQVRLLLLGKVASLAEEHYLPIVSQTKSLLIEAGRIEQNEPLQSVDKLFFHVVMLLRLMDHLRSAKGGVFLQKRTSERVVGGAWGVARSAFYGAMGEACVSKSIAGVGVAWTYATFTDHQDQLKDLRGVFNEWLAGTGQGAANFGKFYEYLGVLDVIQAVFLFEADRPLSEEWYEEPSQLRFRLPQPTAIPANKKLPKSQQDQAESLKVDLEAFYGRPVILQR